MLGAVLALACQPEDESPGAWLSGEEAVAGVEDWRFTDAIEEIHIETRPWYGIPHSTTIWCVSIDGALYVGSYGSEKKRWERIIASRPEARLRIAGKLHDVTLSPVADTKLERALEAAYHEKYDMEAVFGEDVPRWWYYEVTQRDPSRLGRSG
jgi:hypothetical protein